MLLKCGLELVLNINHQNIHYNILIFHFSIYQPQNNDEDFEVK